MSEEASPIRAENKESAVERAVDAAADAETRLSKRTKAEALLSLALAHWRPARSDTGTGLAIPLDGAPLAVEIGDKMGDKFKKQLALLSYEETGTVPAGSVIADAARVFEMLSARADSEPVDIRVGPTLDESHLIYDLGRADYQAVAIRPGCWEIVPDLGATVFRRSSATLGQVLPSTSATPADLNLMAEVLNLAPSGWELLRSLMVVSLIPGVPKPIGILTGEAGSGKSDATKLVLRALDPQAAELQSPPKKMRDLIVSADASYVLGFDNLSNIDVEMSDAMCRLATGAGVRVRSLYTDRNLAIFDQLRAIIVNGIDLSELRGDLIDRAVPIQLVRIPSEKRLTEKAVQARFEELRPEIVGGLFATVAAAMARVDKVNLPTMPRMADAAIWFTAVDQVFLDLGIESRSLQLLTHSRQALFRAMVESDELALAVASLAKSLGGSTWTGTTSDLRILLMSGRPDTPSWIGGSVAALGVKLRRMATSLREAELVDIEFDRSGPRRVLHITELGEEGI
jgi:hypothetical protein